MRTIGGVKVKGVKVKKFSHKNAITHEKRGSPRFSADNPKYPPLKNLAKIPRTPLWISN
jgi:hypothetical protein